MRSENIRNRFENAANEYNNLIHRLVPWYHEQNEIVVNLIPFDRPQAIKVLDLGVGTGALSSAILSHFSKSKVVMFDLAQNMINECRSNLSAYEDRITFRLGNFGTDNIGCNYDVVVSGFAIHHLKDNEKKRLFGRIYRALNPGGVFLIREIVLGMTPSLTEKYRKMWCGYIKSNNEDDGMWLERHLNEDLPSTVEDQVDWLKRAGFSDVGCHWRYLNFAIFGGRKASTR